jgi:hypothetical protein
VADLSFTRRRAILLLSLTSVILITMDLRGSSVINFTRSAFGVVFRPIESATKVVTRPLGNAWNGITHYNEVVEENNRLNDLVAFSEGSTISAIASVREAQELLSLNGLPTLAGIASCRSRGLGQKHGTSSAFMPEPIIHAGARVWAINGLRVVVVRVLQLCLGGGVCMGIMFVVVLSFVVAFYFRPYIRRLQFQPELEGADLIEITIAGNVPD